MRSEFELIEKYFATPARKMHVSSHDQTARALTLGIGDDCALFKPAPDKELAVSTDLFIEGTHFFSDTSPEAIGHKALAVNLSDCAAMGATPKFVTLSLALPKTLNTEAIETFLKGFAKGFFKLAKMHQVHLIGGDTTRISLIDSPSQSQKKSKNENVRAPITINITIFGEVDSELALKRSGANIGDDIWLSGPLGLAAAATQVRYGKLELQPVGLKRASLALDYPTPRVELAKALLGYATAAIDISDGFAQDLGHILNQSNVSAQIKYGGVHRARGFLDLDYATVESLALHGGDDYELCFTAPESKRLEISNICATYVDKVMPIGIIVPNDLNKPSELFLQTGLDGPYKNIKLRGFDHFA